MAKTVLILFHTGILHGEIQRIRLGYLLEKISEHGIDSFNSIPHRHFYMAQSNSSNLDKYQRRFQSMA
jgi:hypothetical protein